MDSFIPLEELSASSKIAILKLCVGNMVFVVLGLVAIALGAYYTVPANVLEFIADYIEGVPQDQLSELLDENTTQVIMSICIILIAVGIGITVVSMVGFCGAVQRNQHCMMGYVVFLVILVIAESAGLAVFGAYKNKIDEFVRDSLKKTLSTEYKFGRGSGLGLTVTFDFIQMQFDCCGVDGSADYDKWSGWRKKYNADANDNDTTSELLIPPFCCKFKPDRNKWKSKLTWPELVAFEEASNSYSKEHIVNYFAKSNKWVAGDCLDRTVGLLEAAWTREGHMFKALTNALLGVALTILILEILSLMAACVLTCDVMSVKSVEGKRMEKELEMKAERDTILAGIQATGSLGAFAMTGGMGAAAGTGSRQDLVRTSMISRGPVRSQSGMAVQRHASRMSSQKMIRGSSLMRY